LIVAPFTIGSNAEIGRFVSVFTSVRLLTEIAGVAVGLELGVPVGVGIGVPVGGVIGVGLGTTAGVGVGVGRPSVAVGVGVGVAVGVGVGAWIANRYAFQEFPDVSPELAIDPVGPATDCCLSQPPQLQIAFEVEGSLNPAGVPNIRDC
jgi:hypothetical protein